MSNLELLKQGYQLFSEGKIDEVFELWDDKISWDECKGFPFVKQDGVYIGKEAVMKGIFAQLPLHYDNFNIEISDFIDGGDKIVMEGHYSGVWKPTGKGFKANATHTWTFKNGKITHFFQAVDTALIINP